MPVIPNRKPKWGGVRNGAGRKFGVPNRYSRETLEKVAAKHKTTPLEVIMTIMGEHFAERTAWQAKMTAFLPLVRDADTLKEYLKAVDLFSQSTDKALEAAIAAAGYMHPKQAAVYVQQHTQEDITITMHIPEALALEDRSYRDDEPVKVDADSTDSAAS